MNKIMSSFIVLFLSFSSFLPVLSASIAEFDQVWRKRTEESWNRTLEAYVPNPEEVVNHLNMHVQRHLKESGLTGLNSTRRQLGKGYNGPCRATNPIDACWRCNPNWANNRFRLADCVLGFGRNAKGGKGGRIYVVTDPSDDDMINPKPGTLRHAVIQKGPLWIIFARDMMITLKQELMVTSHKTIDGRGATVHIAYGAGITIQGVQNVIIHNLKIHHIVSKNGGMIRDSVDHYGQRGVSDGDGVSVFASQNIWLDHLSMTKCYDGIIDIVQGSTAITISNCHFTDHDHTLLFGASEKFEGDAKMQITVAFNHFGKRLVQRMPRVRWGFVHIVNNDYTHWQMYAIGGSAHPTIISQGNRYIADDPWAKKVTMRLAAPESEWRKWTWVSDGDMFLRDAYFDPTGDQQWYKKHPNFSDQVKPGPATQVAQLTKFAGAIGCRVKKAC